MSVLVFADSAEGKFKKSAFEVVSFGKKVAEQLESNLIVLTINANKNEELYVYGAEKVIAVSNDSLTIFNAKAYASVINQVAAAQGSSVVILDSSIDGLFVAPMVAVALNAGYASNVVALPSATNPFTVKRKAFSSKAFSNTVISGKVTIADADIVVSAGRGLKGPENWGMIEELADVLGAATACSKPVSDLGWRPHGEHVGQTGKPVASNLYIAIGISGAIQHLAGINASKVKVVINTDPEAPFFKAADYGIVGDAFEVVPKLIEKLKAFKQA